ncbi:MULTISPECIES: transposase [Bacillus]|uniref:transposase n=1 Tax=Bacillus TaxID=1386 RepID=UPI0020C9FAA1|nr:transposase [Bacillus cereus]
MKKISGLQAVWKGRDLIIAPKNYASSQLYSCCGYKNKDVKKLNLLEWDCPCCGTLSIQNVGIIYFSTFLVIVKYQN